MLATVQQCCALQAHPWIDFLVKQVRQQVENHGRNGNIDGDGFHDREITALHCQDDFTPNPGNREEPLNQESTDQQGRQVGHDIGHDRYRRIAQDMHPENPLFRQAFRACCPDIILPEFIEHECPVKPQVRRDADHQQDQDWQQRIPQGPQPGDIPTLYREPA